MGSKKGTVKNKYIMKLLKTAEVRDCLDKQERGEISYSRMVESLNTIAFRNMKKSDTSAHLDIYKRDGEVRISFLPILSGYDRLFDLMQWLEVKDKEGNVIDTLEEELSFSLSEAKIIISYLNNLINEFERINDI